MNLRGAGDERDSMTIKSYESLENEISLPSFFAGGETTFPQRIIDFPLQIFRLIFRLPAMDIKGDVFTYEKYIDSKLR